MDGKAPANEPANDGVLDFGVGQRKGQLGSGKELF